MQFNANKTEEVVFSCKKVKPYHLQALLGNDILTRESHHKHLGMQLDSEVNFHSHIKEFIGKARRGVGMIRHLSMFLGVCLTTYHKYDPEMCLSFTQRLEQTQYNTALAVAGAWRDTNRQRLYEELGW